MQPQPEEYSKEETARRADAALRAALATPPKPHSESKIGKPSRKRRTTPKRAKAVRKRTGS
jgi:hypothetical protein